MAVFLRRSDEVGDIDSSIHWYAVTGTKVELDHNLKLRDLGARLEEEFDGKTLHDLYRHTTKLIK